jgi:hypothetical protein
MNWEAIGAIGELLGSAVVFISLVYLAVQVRQNTRAIRSDTHQQWVTMNSAQNLLFPQSTEFATVFVKALNNPDQLTDVEQIQVHALVLNVMNTIEALYFQTMNGAIDNEFLESRQSSFLGFFRIKLVQEWWEQNSSRELDARFIEYIDRIRSERNK